MAANQHINKQEFNKKKPIWKILFFYDYFIISKNINYILFWLILIIIYIYNGHTYEQKGRRINREIKQIREIEYGYKHVSEQWTFKTKESELEQKLQDRKMSVAKSPPFIIDKKSN